MLLFFVWPESGLSEGVALRTTFTNPRQVPANFGIAAAAVGHDKFLIGDNVGQAAYLFSTDGTLLTSFTPPKHAPYGSFGGAVAAIGNDRVLIGAWGDNTGAERAGSAYLFSNSGMLLTTFNNPAPASEDNFGYSLTAVGSDRLLISSHQDDTGARDAGSAYLFSTDGALMTTFHNPTPSLNDNFGRSMAAVGSDKVLIGAPFDSTGAQGSGAAYLFGTDGILLRTFNNPTPAVGDNFGTTVAAVGTDRVLIGAPGDDTSGRDAGMAYLFGTNGTLLVTFTNPKPRGYSFGVSAAAVGSNLVIIGAAFDNVISDSAGAGYLFSTGGTLITAISNPAPAAFGRFSFAIAVAGNDQVLFGAPGNFSGAVAGAGAAYLFDLPPPLISIARTGGSVSLSWVTAETGLILEQTDKLGLSTTWSTTPESITLSDLIHTVQQPIIVNGAGSRFFRLRRP